MYIGTKHIDPSTKTNIIYYSITYSGGASARETKCGFKNLEHNPAICLSNVSYKSRNKAANNALWRKKRTYRRPGNSKTFAHTL